MLLKAEIPMLVRVLLSFLLLLPALPCSGETSDTVTWSIGNEASAVDGIAGKGPVTFQWTFDRPVEHGVYLDGTPWVVWVDGLKLLEVSPAKQRLTVPTTGDATLNDAVVDATCINPLEDELPLDQRMGDGKGGGPWGDGTKVWDGAPTAVSIGDCIVTGRSRRNTRPANRRMLFTAIGACNIVGKAQQGHYRPPLRMPPELRAKLVTPAQVKVESLPTFEIEDPRDWEGNPVTLNLSQVASDVDADLLMNGPVGHLGVHSHIWYETANGILNHDVRGTDEGAYHRDTADRIAHCLHTAFDPDVDEAKRQRSLDKFIQNGLDYYYMHALGYPVWNGGGGHPNGIEGIITITGALLKDTQITDDMKYQRFSGAAVGKDDLVTDMLAGYQGAFTRSEALHIVTAAPWKSGTFKQRAVGKGALSLDDALIRLDFADPEHVLNVRDVPLISIADTENGSAISVGPDFHWPMHARNRATEARRSFRYLLGAVLRIDGDDRIRKVIDFRADADSPWTEKTWDAAKGQGGIVIVYPPVTAADRKKFGKATSFTTGLATKSEVQADSVALWESWPADSKERVLTTFFHTPTQDYLEIKLEDQFQWLPYYHLLDDPGSPGKKLYEESPTYQEVKRFVCMQRNFGQYFWAAFTQGPNVPNAPTIQALTRHYLLDDKMPDTFCIEYGANDSMWTD